MNLERSKHSVEVVAKDEDIRKLRLQQLILEDEKDDLHSQLSEEEARSDGLEQALDEALAQLEQLQLDNQSFQNDMRTQSREIANLKVGSILNTRQRLKIHSRNLFIFVQL